MKIIAHLLMVLAFTSVSLAADKPRESLTDDIREAVFRWQFDHNASGLQKKAQAYFLAVGEKGADPTDDFLKRFTAHKPPIRKVSACTDSANKGVLDKKTGERGLIFRITRIEWRSKSEVDVSGGYYEAGQSASENTYTVKKERGRWKVTNDKVHWIS